MTDCDDTDPDVYEINTWYLDADGDGYAVSTMESCGALGAGYTLNQLPITDCNDNDPNIFEPSTWYLDTDDDGYAVSSIESCGSPGAGYTLNPLPITDCDDNEALINPDTIWYLDANNDGVADSYLTVTGCENPGVGYTNIKPTIPPTESDIIMYPNPSSEIVQINLGEAYEIMNLTIVNSSKQLVFKKRFMDKQILEIDVINYSSGVYFIHLSNDEGFVDSKKFIKL